MPNQKPSMLIFGALPTVQPRDLQLGLAGSSRAFVERGGAESSRVSVDTVAANLRAVIEQVGVLIGTALEPAGKFGVAYVDVNLAVAADGSVGLLGTGATATNKKGTLTVRLEPRVLAETDGQGRPMDGEARIQQSPRPYVGARR